LTNELQPIIGLELPKEIIEKEIKMLDAFMKEYKYKATAS